MTEADKKLGDQFREKALQNKIASFTKANAALNAAVDNLEAEIKKCIETGRGSIKIKLGQRVRDINDLLVLDGYRKLHAQCEKMNVGLEVDRAGGFGTNVFMTGICWVYIRPNNQYGTSATTHPRCHQPARDVLDL